MEEEMLKLFNDWGVENADNLYTWIEPILKREIEKAEARGRSDTYKSVVAKLTDSWFPEPMS